MRTSFEEKATSKGNNLQIGRTFDNNDLSASRKLSKSLKLNRRECIISINLTTVSKTYYNNKCHIIFGFIFETVVVNYLPSTYSISHCFDYVPSVNSQ